MHSNYHPPLQATSSQTWSILAIAITQMKEILKCGVIEWIHVRSFHFGSDGVGIPRRTVDWHPFLQVLSSSRNVTSNERKKGRGQRLALPVEISTHGYHLRWSATKLSDNISGVCHWNQSSLLRFKQSWVALMTLQWPPSFLMILQWNKLTNVYRNPRSRQRFTPFFLQLVAWHAQTYLGHSAK